MRRCLVWHPESPGVKQVVWRPWWRRSPFASLRESIRASRPYLDLTK